jgi:hypothetical protein
MLKARRDLGAHPAARPQQRPRPIQAVRDRVFRPEWHFTLATVYALTDLSALQRDIIIVKTLHGSIVPQQRNVVADNKSRFRLQKGVDYEDKTGQPEPRDISWGISSVGNTELPQFRSLSEIDLAERGINDLQAVSCRMSPESC